MTESTATLVFVKSKENLNRYLGDALFFAGEYCVERALAITLEIERNV
jgi:hypothetical protein